MSTAYWLLKIIGASEAPITAGAIAIEAPSVAAADLARLLGPATPAPPVQAAARPQTPVVRMQLLGVVSSRKDGGVALILVEGQPARPYRVGSAIDGGYKLTRVTARSATLTPIQEGAQAMTLELASTSVNFPPRQTPPTGPANPALAAQPPPDAAPAITPQPARQ